MPIGSQDIAALIGTLGKNPAQLALQSMKTKTKVQGEKETKIQTAQDKLAEAEKKRSAKTRLSKEVEAARRLMLINVLLAIVVQLAKGGGFDQSLNEVMNKLSSIKTSGADLEDIAISIASATGSALVLNTMLTTVATSSEQMLRGTFKV